MQDEDILLKVAGSEPVEEVFVPGPRPQGIDRMNDAPAEQPLPEPVDDGARVGTIAGMGHQPGELLEALLARRGGNPDDLNHATS
jgi:hypothetical protein